MGREQWAFRSRFPDHIEGILRLLVLANPDLGEWLMPCTSDPEVLVLCREQDVFFDSCGFFAIRSRAQSLFRGIRFIMR